jgi:hypothetical protein
MASWCSAESLQGTPHFSSLSLVSFSPLLFCKDSMSSSLQRSGYYWIDRFPWSSPLGDLVVAVRSMLEADHQLLLALPRTTHHPLRSLLELTLWKWQATISNTCPCYRRKSETLGISGWRETWTFTRIEVQKFFFCLLTDFWIDTCFRFRLTALVIESL